MMVNYVSALREFHNKYGHVQFSVLTVPGAEHQELRYRLIDEEINKELLPLFDKIKVAYYSGTSIELNELMVEFADALADSLYVIFGTAIAFGIPIDQIFAEVHRSNMTKSTKKNEFGKTIKGDDWEPPQLRRLLIREE